MDQEIQQPSPYDCPSTPIASARRPRTTPRSKNKIVSSPTSYIPQSPLHAPKSVKDGIHHVKMVALCDKDTDQQQYRKKIFSPAFHGMDEEDENTNKLQIGFSYEEQDLTISTTPTTGDEEDDIGELSDSYGTGTSVDSTSFFPPNGGEGDDELEGLVEVDENGQLISTPLQEEEEKGMEEEDHQDEEDEEEEEEYYEDEFNPYLFIKQLPLYRSVTIPSKICLPPSSYSIAHRPLSLVLDLDETLVHCTVDRVPNPDYTFPVDYNGTTYQVYVKKRPFLDYFLRTVSKDFEVIVFTASQPVYANKLLDLLDTDDNLVEHRLFRDACLEVGGNYLKDLAVLGRDMKRSVLVDNSPHAYSYQVDNGIPIESWFDDPSDTELLKLVPFLRRLQQCEDVRPLVREQFKTYQLIDKA